MPFTYASTTNQAERRSIAAHLLAKWEHERTTAWWSHALDGGPSVIPTDVVRNVHPDTYEPQEVSVRRRFFLSTCGGMARLSS